MQSSLQKKIGLFVILFLFTSSSFLSQKALAGEIVISGNGSDSVNTAVASDATTSNVSQNNSTTIDNSVAQNATTGNNSASENTGGSTIVQTGDVATNTSITNAANTSSTSQNTCCSSSGTLVIVSGNGAGSQNTVTSSNTTNNNLTVNQTANVTNNVYGYANTGGNTANYNTGTTTIKTGSISVTESIKNGPINVSQITLNGTRGTSVNAVISGNGSYSTNELTFLTKNTNNVSVNNVANIFTNTLLTLNTGDNEASDNTGDVYMETGDIDTEAVIENGPINTSVVTIDCKCKEKEKPQEQAPVTPVEKVTPQAPTSSSEKPSHSGEVASITASKVLPVTGISWLIVAFMGNVMMLFLGMILRLRSGNSPGVFV